MSYGAEPAGSTRAGGTSQEKRLTRRVRGVREADVDASTMLIDTDVHEGLGGVDELLPFLADPWRHHLTDPGWSWRGSNIDLIRYLFPHLPARREWLKEGDKEAANDDPALTAVHLFEGEGVTTAILNGFFHISRMKTDVEFGAALGAAYNDWQVARWLEADQRYKGSVHIHAGMPDLAAREIDRVAEHPGIVQVFLPLDNDRQYGDPFYKPIFEAAKRNNLAVAFHHDQGTSTILGYPRFYTEWHTLAAPQGTQGQLSSLIFNGVFDAYPDLKVVFLETGVSWLPWFMWRADQQYRELRANVPWVKRLPSDHIRDNVRLATQPITEVTARQFTQLVEMANSDRVFMFATDYPHYDADSRDVLDKLPETLRERIQYKNALETYPRLGEGIGA